MCGIVEARAFSTVHGRQAHVTLNHLNNNGAVASERLAPCFPRLALQGFFFPHQRVLTALTNVNTGTLTAFQIFLTTLYQLQL